MLSPFLTLRHYSLSFLILVLLIVVTYVCLYTWHLGQVAQQEQLIPLVTLDKISFQTGDLVLFRHKKYRFGELFSKAPLISHLGVVWNTPLYGPCVLDFNPNPNGPYDANALPFAVPFKGRNLLVYSIYDAVQHYPGDIFIRKLRKPLTEKQDVLFSEAVTDWAIHLRYEEFITTYDIFTYLMFIISTLAPEVSLLLARMLTPMLRFRTSSFCTELVSELLRRCGVLSRNDVRYSFLWGPMSWMHGMRQGTGSKDHYWAPEVQVLA